MMDEPLKIVAEGYVPLRDPFDDDAAAQQAAEFVAACMDHVHRGVIDCGNKYIVYGNDGCDNDVTRREVELVRRTLVCLGLYCDGFGVSEDRDSWAILVNEDEPKIPIAELLERGGKIAPGDYMAAGVKNHTRDLEDMLWAAWREASGNWDNEAAKKFERVQRWLADPNRDPAGP